MSAITDLNESIGKLTTAVDNAVAKLGQVPPNNDTDINAAKLLIEDATAKLNQAVGLETPG